MDERARGVYRGFATFFLVVGALFLALGLVPGALEGDPTPVALLLLLVGAGLRWTVRDGGHDEQAAGAAPTAPEGEEGPRDVGPGGGRVGGGGEGAERRERGTAGRDDA